MNDSDSNTASPANLSEPQDSGPLGLIRVCQLIAKGVWFKEIDRMSVVGTQGWSHTLLRILVISSILGSQWLSVQVASAKELSPRHSQIINLMSELKPLPKVHYSWPIRVLSLPDQLLYQYARLTSAISIVGEGYEVDDRDRTVEAITAAHETCAAVNQTKPRIKCSLGITYSVWHRHFGKRLPPTDTGKSHRVELEKLKEKLARVKVIVRRLNRRAKMPVAVSAVLFDSERFVIRDHDQIWNDAITSKHNEAYEVAQAVFPKARIEWYARGGVAPGSSPTGWNFARYLTLEETGSTFATSLYRVPEIEATREMFRRTYKNAQKHGVDEVTPWIALGSGYRRQVDKFHAWSFDWNYDLIYSWQLGLEVNQYWYGTKERAQRFAPWNAAKIVVFYPEPLGRAKHWAAHFIAYVRGANDLKDLSSIDIPPAQD